jgi:hypothetical protein
MGRQTEWLFCVLVDLSIQQVHANGLASDLGDTISRSVSQADGAGRDLLVFGRPNFMSEEHPICSSSGGWMHVAGRSVGYATVEGAVKACSVLLMVMYMRWTRWRVSHGHLTAAKNLVFPIYGYILYFVAVIDLTEAVLLEVSPYAS